MNKNHHTRLKLALGSFALDFEGSETFLKEEVPKLIDHANAIRISQLTQSAIELATTMPEALRLIIDLEAAKAALKSELDSVSDLGEMEALRLQMAMDRLSKMMSTLSNLLKKISDTASTITQNLK